MSKKGELNQFSIAIVHDALTRRGGAEIVLEELLRLLPQAHVYSLYAGNNQAIQIDNLSYRIRTSYLQKFPLWFRRHQSRLLPLLPHAAEQFDLSGYDLVLSSSSAFAKAIITRVDVPHICYCHTPTRYLWDSTHEIIQSRSHLSRLPARLLFHFLRLADFAAAQRVDYFLANSHYTRHRLKTYYRRDSHVIYPPVDTGFFTPNVGTNEVGLGLPHRGYFLCVGRLNQSKHFDQAVRVCNKLRLPLVIVGDGPKRTYLAKLGLKNIRLISRVEPRLLRNLYRSARAFLQPGTEDFGLATAESLGCGTPVIALGKGGANEIVANRETGILYQTDRDETLADAIRQFIVIEKKFTAERLQKSVLGFSRYNFKTNLLAFIDKVLDDKERQEIKS